MELHSWWVLVSVLLSALGADATADAAVENTTDAAVHVDGGDVFVKVGSTSDKILEHNRTWVIVKHKIMSKGSKFQNYIISINVILILTQPQIHINFQLKKYFVSTLLKKAVQFPIDSYQTSHEIHTSFLTWPTLVVNMTYCIKYFLSNLRKKSVQFAIHDYQTSHVLLMSFGS